MLSLAILAVALSARADIEFGPHDVATVFFVDKSDDRNRVDYGVRLDARCAPASSRPMVVYWREIEGGRTGNLTHDLSFLEQRLYGVRRQDVVPRRNDLPTTRVELEALPARTIQIMSRREGDRCGAIASTTIGGAPARFLSVHLTLSGPGRLTSVELIGRNRDGHEVRERVGP